MQRITLLIFVVICRPLIAQYQTNIGATSVGVGGTASVLTDEWSTVNNPAAMGFHPSSSIGLSYQNRYLLNELSTSSLSFLWSFKKKGKLGSYFSHYGNNMYRLMSGGLSYGMKLHPTFSMGIGLNYHRLQFGDIYGFSHRLSATFGLYYQLNSNLDFGFVVHNASRSALSTDTEERFPTRFNLGVKYQFSKQVFWSVEAEKYLTFPLNVKSGILYKHNKQLSISLGVNTKPVLMAFGVGLQLKHFQFYMSAAWYQSLGVNPAMSFTYDWME